MSDNQKIYIAFLVIGVALLIVLFSLYFFHKVYKKKHYKEATYLKLSKLAKYEDFLLINNYKISFDQEHIGVVDHILGGNKYLYFINDFSLSGVISGELKSYHLRQVDKEKKVNEIVNPLNYNINLIKRFTQKHNIDQSFIKGIVVINDDSSININGTGKNFYMTTRKNLINLIYEIEESEEKNLKEKSLIDLMVKLSKENA